MKNKPIIGITVSYVNHNSYMEGVYVHHDYHKAVTACGGLPILLPVTDPETALELAELCDGIISTGGEDVNPKFYGKEPHPQLGYTYPERDEVEIATVRYCLETKKPFLGICRGHQLLNAALGGTLIQDIPNQFESPLQHFQKVERRNDSHQVEIKENSLLYKILGESVVRVNSLHHQCIQDLSDQLVAVAHASDGVIEAVEHKTMPFMMGVQWHPESLATWNPQMKNLFQTFVDKCRL